MLSSTLFLRGLEVNRPCSLEVRHMTHDTWHVSHLPPTLTRTPTKSL